MQAPLPLRKKNKKKLKSVNAGRKSIEKKSQLMQEEGQKGKK